MRIYRNEYDNRIKFIREVVTNAGATGIVFGNSGGKDSALAGILCKAACPDTVGVIMPCGSMRNFIEDKDDALALAHLYGIETREVDLTLLKSSIVKALGKNVSPAASANIGPRLRMTTLYTIAASENRLVCGTGNRSEIYMGYFTKFGDGASDFNPVADLTVSEVFEFLRFLKAPDSILSKVPSAGLFEGQTDETDMGISYRKIDEYLLYGNAATEDRTLIELAHGKTEHKRKPPLTFM